MVNILIILLYLAIAILHIYIVKSSIFVIFLVIIFEVVRLLVVYQKALPLIAIYGMFSSIFIIYNYYELLASIKVNTLQSSNIINNINNYTSKYWVNQNIYKQLIEKQEALTHNYGYYPNIILVASLVILIEFALAYLCRLQKQEHKLETKKQQNTNESIYFENSIKKYELDGKTYSKSGYYKKLKQLKQLNSNLNLN